MALDGLRPRAPESRASGPPPSAMIARRSRPARTPRARRRRATGSAAACPLDRRGGTPRSAAGRARGRPARRLRRRQRAGPREIVRVDVEQRRSPDRTPDPPHSAPPSKPGKTTVWLADGKRHELPVAAEASELLERPLRAPRASASSACPRSARCRANGVGFVGMRLRVGRHLARRRRSAGYCRYSIGNSGVPLVRSNTKTNPCLVVCDDGIDRAAVPPDASRGSAATAGRDPRCRDARTGSARCACRSRRRARAGSSRRGCRRGGWRRRNRPPPIRSARRRCRAPASSAMPGQLLAPPLYGPRVLRPRLVAGLARMRDRVERPAQRAGAHVVGADVAGRRRQPFADAAADDHEILVDDARRWSAGRSASPDRGPRPWRRSIRPLSPNVAIGLPVARIERVEVLIDRGEDATVVAAGPVHQRRGSAPRPSMPESNVHRCSPVAARSANVLCVGV